MDTIKTLAVLAKHFPQASASLVLAVIMDLEGVTPPVLGYNLQTIDGRTAKIQTFTPANGYAFDYRTQKIQAIKEIRHLTGLGLKESKDAVDLAVALYKRDNGEHLTPTEWDVVDGAHWKRQQEKGYQHDVSYDASFDDEPPF